MRSHSLLAMSSRADASLSWRRALCLAQGPRSTFECLGCPLALGGRLVEGTGGWAGGAGGPAAGAGAQVGRVLLGARQLPPGLAEVGRAVRRDRGAEILAFDVQVGQLAAPVLV